MPESNCLAQLNVCALRIADIDPGSGVPLPGSETLQTVDSMVEIVITPNVTTGDDQKEKNACGATKVAYTSPDSVDRYDVKVTVLDRNPYVNAALGGGLVLTSGGANGYAAPSLGEVAEAPKSLELWAKRIDNGVLAQPNPYAWWVLPWTSYWREDVITKATATDKPAFLGRAFENANWFDGPLNDWPVASTRAWQWFPVSALPVVSCDPQAIPVS